MKYSDYLFTPGSRVIATGIGVITGGIMSFLFGWELGLLSGAATAILFSFVIPFLVYRADVPYAKIKKTITSPIIFDERVRFTVRQGSVGGYFILTRDSMVLLSLERGDHRMELSREDVKKIFLSDPSGLCIHLGEKQYVRILSSYCEEMLNVLSENGWNVTSTPEEFQN